MAILNSHNRLLDVDVIPEDCPIIPIVVRI